VIPPMVMWFKVQWFGIWISLFLLLPIVIMSLLLVMPLVFIGMAITGNISRFWIAIRIVLAAYKTVCATRGLRIDIHKKNETTFEVYLP
jgi:hypothetical protein